MPSATKPRDPWFDNAKMALVTLVVVGHSWTLLPANRVDDHLYDFLYVWHVPAFVFVTGYLSRSFAWNRDRMWHLFRTVVVPYVVFECALALFRIYVGGEQLEDLFADPHWPMWYLSALFFWRLVTPAFRPLWGGVVVAVLISLVAGMRAGDTLDLARIVGLLPFFVLGLKATPERLALLRGRPWVKVVGAGVLVTIAILTTWTDSWASTEWLYYRSQYGELGTSDLRSFLTRGVLLVVGTLGAWAFLSLLPRRGGWFATMGSASLVVYLFHGFVVKGLEYSSYPDWAAAHPWIALPVTTLGAVLLALALASPPVSRRLGVLVDPLGLGERHLVDAVALHHAKTDAEEHADGVAEAIAEITDSATTHDPRPTG